MEDPILPEGLPVTVQFPLAGNPLNATLAVELVQVGWVIVPIVGAEGALEQTEPPIEKEVITGLPPDAALLSIIEIILTQK